MPMHLLPGFAVVRDLGDSGVGKDVGVERGGLLGLAVKSQAGGDFLKDWHGVCPFDQGDDGLRIQLCMLSTKTIK